uniref:TF-B3 domain-containing protein n=1 Tax=Chenopodium quinoa TaxID=63459 RepID=A0A803ML10_CHEQI
MHEQTEGKFDVEQEIIGPSGNGIVHNTIDLHPGLFTDVSELPVGRTRGRRRRPDLFALRWGTKQVYEDTITPLYIEESTSTDDSCQDVDIEPLSGKPYFPIVIVKSHIGLVAYKYQVILPIQFSQALPNKTIPVILTRGGKSWETTYLGENAPSYKRFDSRWRAFAEDNNLKVGDVCVFELVEQSDTLLKFKVQVLQGDFPSMLLNKEDGTINNPIVVE